MQDALNRTRKNEPEVEEDQEEDLVDAFSKITKSSLPKTKTKKQKEKKIVDWLQHDDTRRIDTVDDPTATAFTKLAGIPYERRTFSGDEKKRKVMQDALNR